MSNGTFQVARYDGLAWPDPITLTNEVFPEAFLSVVNFGVHACIIDTEHTCNPTTESSAFLEKNSL
jgi:hypothetical protein